MSMRRDPRRDTGRGPESRGPETWGVLRWMAVFGAVIIGGVVLTRFATGQPTLFGAKAEAAQNAAPHAAKHTDWREPPRERAYWLGLDAYVQASTNDHVYVDPRTGCHYLVIESFRYGVAMTPRLKPNGLPLCQRPRGT